MATRCSPLPFLRLILINNNRVCVIGSTIESVWLERLKRPCGGSVRHYVPTDRLLRVSLIGIIFFKIGELCCAVKFVKCESARYLEHCPSIHLGHHLVCDHHSHTKFVRQPGQTFIIDQCQEKSKFLESELKLPFPMTEINCWQCRDLSNVRRNCARCICLEESSPRPE